jgi:two-component system, NarL family, response regulator NreC
LCRSIALGAGWLVMRTRIVIADDHKIGREGLRALFKSEDDIEVIGEADDKESLLRVTQKLSPDIVFLSLGIPGLNGIEATRQMLAAMPTLRVIGLAPTADGQFVRELLAAGSAGFITWRNGFTDFLAAIRSVMAQRTYLSPDVAQIMMDQYVLRPRMDPREMDNPALTPREREVLQLVAEGMSTKEVAAQLELSTKTVDMHRQHIMGKLKLHSVAELTKYAIREGLTALHS